MWRAAVWKLCIGEIARLGWRAAAAVAVWGAGLGALAIHWAESRQQATEGKVLASVLTQCEAAAGFLPGRPSPVYGMFQKATQAALML